MRREIIQAVLLKQLEYLKDNQLMQELYVWELSGNSSFRAIQVEREKNGHKLQLELEKRLGNSCKDCNFYITIIIAAINYIILFSRHYCIAAFFTSLCPKDNLSFKMWRPARNNRLAGEKDKWENIFICNTRE